VEPVDVLVGGFPCQDISNAGKQAGITGARSGLWFEYARAIRELRPRYVVVENVAALTNRGLDAVLGSLAEIGCDAEWTVLGARHVGAPHARDRLWILVRMANPSVQGCAQQRECVATESPQPHVEFYDFIVRKHEAESAMGRATDGMADWVERSNKGYWNGEWESSPRLADAQPNRTLQLESIGNGQVPQCAAHAFRLLMHRFTNL
jgi:DNA (cytosine-5)-methyltransferase 1